MVKHHYADPVKWDHISHIQQFIIIIIRTFCSNSVKNMQGIFNNMSVMYHIFNEYGASTPSSPKRPLFLQIRYIRRLLRVPFSVCNDRHTATDAKLTTVSDCPVCEVISLSE